MYGTIQVKMLVAKNQQANSESLHTKPAMKRIIQIPNEIIKSS